MSPKQMTAVAVIDRQPTDQEAKALALDLLNTPEDPRLTIEWFCSNELPPIEATGLPLFDYDQLAAHRRDLPESVYLVVLVEYP